MLVGLISHPLCLKHDMGVYHPECPQRLTAIEDHLIAQGLNMMLRHYDAPAATREQLERVHDAAYVDEIFARAPVEGYVQLDEDTLMNPYTLEAALRAAGSAVLGVDLVMQGEIASAFCNVRPPGHHAEHDRAMGFCIFNNVAVGAAHALATHGLQRVAIVDFDVHHGNGTEHIFAAEPRVLFCSTFQHPFYPHTGAQTDTPHIVNVPLPAGADGAVFREAVTAHWLPRLEAFVPEFVFISAGFDGHIEDDMAMLALREDDYRWVTQQIQAVARRHAQGRIVSLLEGGYELHALARSAFAHIDALVD
ncbi:MAG TPA: histone deacetylase family protein [Thioalkalivibrio sp.]|nr:histone deacetylase family protein [Thioalkalivibrio sp.]